MRRTRVNTSRCGLTLVELVVVLAILVLLAGTAITATEGLVEQSRWEATERTLTSLEDALLGPFDQQGPAVRPAIAGFVADVGRLPEAQTGSAEIVLAELWSLPAGVAAFTIQSPSGDPELRLPGGWRGPYLRLGLGSSELRDGWGRAFLATRADGTAAAVGEAITVVESLGADGLAGGTGYDLDLAIAIERTVPPLQNARHRGSIPVRLTSSATSGFLVVRVYGPRDGVVRTLDQRVFTASTAGETAILADLPIGPRIVRAYATATDPTATPDMPVDSPTARSLPVAVTLVQGGVPEIELVLP